MTDVRALAVRYFRDGMNTDEAWRAASSHVELQTLEGSAAAYVLSGRDLPPNSPRELAGTPAAAPISSPPGRLVGYERNG